MGKSWVLILILLCLPFTLLWADQYYPEPAVLGEPLPEEGPLPKLLEYILEQDALSLESLIAIEGTDLSVTDWEGRNALHYAALQGNTKLADLLIRHGADPAAADSRGMLPVHLAFPVCFETTIKLSLRGKLLFIPDLEGLSVIERAIAQGAASAASLLDSRFVNLRSETGNSILHYAAAEAEREVIAWLINSHASVNHANNEGMLPLDAAFSRTESTDHLQAAQMLIDSHSLPPALSQFSYAYHALRSQEQLVRDTQGNSLLHIAAERGHPALLNYGIDLGLSVELRNKNGQTPLHSAAAAGNCSTAEILISRGSTIDGEDEEGKTPLHYSVEQADDRLVALFLEAGADPDRKDFQGTTPVQRAASNDKTLAILDALLAAGGNAELEDNEGRTPLMTALDRKAWECAKLLLNQGVDIFYTDRHGISVAERILQIGETAAGWHEMENYWALKNRRGNTLLHVAAAAKVPVPVLRLFIEQGCFIDGENLKGETPLHSAIAAGNEHAASLFIELGADVFRQTTQGFSAVELAFRQGAEFTGRVFPDEVLHTPGPSGETLLHRAVWENNSAIVSLLLDRDAGSSIPNHRGLTPLHIAARQNNIPIIQALVRRGAQLDIRDKAGNTALHEAVLHQSARSCRLLLLSGASTDLRNLTGDAPIHLSVFNQDGLLLRTLAEFGASLETRNASGLTPLLLASLQKLSPVAVQLINLGADIHARDPQGNTPLHRAVWNEDELLVRRLMERGADIHGMNRDRESPLTIAFAGSPEPVSWIMDYPMIMERDNNGNTPLHVALHEYAPWSILAQLIGGGAGINTRNNFLETPLHIALIHPYREAVKLLRDSGADMFVKNSNGITPFDLAAGNSLEVLHWLVDEHNSNERDESGNTPLHHAVRGNNTEVVRYLLGIGADPQLPNDAEQTPLDIAEAAGYIQLYGMLSGEY